MKKRKETRDFKKTALRQQAILNHPTKFAEISKRLLDELKDKVRIYSEGVTELDKMARDYENMVVALDAKEAEANDIGARILSATSSTYGRSSEQVKLLGGIRLDDRKKSGRKSKDEEDVTDDDAPKTDAKGE
jgi:hypothetical protein